VSILATPSMPGCSAAAASVSAASTRKVVAPSAYSATGVILVISKAKLCSGRAVGTSAPVWPGRTSAMRRSSTSRVSR